MASKTKTIDIRLAAGGKARRGLRESCASSDGESPPSSPDEDDNGCFEVLSPKKQKFCPEAQRPDLDVSIEEVVKDKLIIRSSQLATHVLVMGSPSMRLEPLPCPFESCGCGSFFAYAPQLLKEHLESKHKLYNVQLNFVCPCPAACNIVNGEPRECGVVEYDPHGGVLAHHMQTQHADYYDKICLALCYRPYPGDPEVSEEEDDNEQGQGDSDDEEDVEFEDYPGEEEPDMDYLKHLNSGKKFPAWTAKKHQLFPSQRIAEKVTIKVVIQNKQMYYACNVHPCGGKIFRYHDIGTHLEEGHPGLLGDACQTQWYERCPACPTTLHWCGKMVLHILAMHPELLGEPKHFVQRALEERAKLQQQIQEVCVGQAIADTAEPGKESDGTKTHMLYAYICPVEGCKKRFDERDFAQWHIIVHHEKQWNVAGSD